MPIDLYVGQAVFFKTNDFECYGIIKEIDPPYYVVKTASGNKYHLLANEIYLNPIKTIKALEVENKILKDEIKKLRFALVRMGK